MLLFVVSAGALYVVPNFGSKFPYADRVLEVTHLPNWIWGFGNFDGVHYLKIAQDGYKADFTQAFFPLYPTIVKIIAQVIPKNISLDHAIYVDPSFFYSGILLSNFFFLASLFLLFKLWRIDFKKNIVLSALLILLAFPTSYYFGAVYSESLFLFLSVLCLYFLRKKNFVLAGVFAALASATRITGILLVLPILIELYIEFKNKHLNFTNLASLLIAPLGLLFYMYYLSQHFGDPLYFLSSQPAFGANRSATLMLFFPQVFYRYFKILTTVPILTANFFNAFLELAFTITALFTAFYLFKKMRLSYWVFTILILLTPILTGTLSSMPRYVLGGFLMIPYVVESQDRHIRLIASLFVILQVILLILFIRGYWVA
jgi:Gpi18-like mannosyltransferase